MITSTTQETYRLTVAGREYVGWVDQIDTGWLTYGAHTHSEIIGTHSDAVAHIRDALIVQAQCDGDNPHRDEVDLRFPFTSRINPDGTVGVDAYIEYRATVVG